MAGALAAGDAAGLLASTHLATGPRSPPTAWLPLAAGLACLLAGRTGLLAGRRPPDAPGRRAEPALLALFVVCAGAALGLRAGTRALRGCTARLETGTATVVAGTLLDRLPARPVDDRDGGSGRSLGRVGLGDATLVAGGRRCRVARVRATVRLGREPRPAGARVVARGAWRAYGPFRLPRSPDGFGGLTAGGIEPVWALAGDTGPVRPTSGGPLLVRLRGALAARLERRLSPERAAIGKALVLADRVTLEPSARRRFADAGILHLLAISGLHVGLVAGALAWLIGLRVPGPRRLAYAALAVTGYVLLIGAPPAAARALLIFWGSAAAAARGRPRRLADVAALAATTLLLWDPLLVGDPGFQLSFAGFAGVVAGHRHGPARLGALRAGWRRARAAVRGRSRGRATSTNPPGAATGSAWARALGASAGAFLATAPIAAVHFDRIVLASVPASLAGTALVGLTVPAVALSALPGPPGELFAPAGEVLLGSLAALADAFAALPLNWDVPRIGAWSWLALGATGVLCLRPPGRRAAPAAVAGALACVSLLAPAWSAWRARGQALLCTLDVGQGDAAVVRTGRGRWLVLDAGPGTGLLPQGVSRASGPPLDSRAARAGRRVLVPFLRARGAKAIEVLAISHPHLDHFGGSGALFDAFRVRHVLDPGVPEPSSAYLGFLARIREEGARWLGARAGDRVRVDDVELEVLWPPRGAVGDANEGSLVLRLTVGRFRYLNSGDAPRSVESAVLARHGREALATDLLKIGHHGSRTSTALEWLRAARPRIAAISVGAANRYGHPHPGTLARIDSARIGRVWRTDHEGTLCVAIGRDGWRVVPP